MCKKLFFILILVALAFGLAAPVGPASADADGARHVYSTVTEFNLCDHGLLPGSPNCSWGTLRTLSNGRSFMYGYKTVVQFTDQNDPRWTALCLFTGDPFPPTSPNLAIVNGSWVCTPNDSQHPEYAGGWWEGHSTNCLGGYVWTGKGFGVLEGLLVIHRNLNNNPINEVEIIELPEYQQ